MAKAKDKHWMEKAFSKHKGALRKTLGVGKKSGKISSSKLHKAAHGRGLTAKRARLALIAKMSHH